MGSVLKWLCPASKAEGVHCIDIEALSRKGIRALLLDLDNTLVPWQGYEVSDEVAEWLQSARKQMKVCIVSNTHSPRRLKKLAESFGVPFAKRAMKPRRGGFREALEMLDVDHGETAVIGDQIFTDILGGNRLGAYTILVTPLHDREFVGTKFTRLFERMVLRLLEQRGMIRSFSADAEIPGEQYAENDSQM